MSLTDPPEAADKWTSEKYIRWYQDHKNPQFVIPLPTGGKRSVTVTKQDGESDADLFQRCKKERDELGERLWGASSWRHMLKVKSRSVTRGGKKKETTGVRHVSFPGRPNAWIAHWYERDAEGKRHQRSKSFSYGTPRSTCTTYGEAKKKALETRRVKERRWYIADPVFISKYTPSSQELFKYEIGKAIVKKVNSLSAEEYDWKVNSKSQKAIIRSLLQSMYMLVSLENMLNLADRLGIQLELTTSPRPSKAD